MCFILCNTKEFNIWKMAKIKTGFVVEMKAPNMMLLWNGSLYIRKNEPPRYLQLLKMNIETQGGQWNNTITYYNVQVVGKTLGIFSWNSNSKNKGFGMGTYIKILVRIDVIKVPKNAKMQIAPKLEKNGLWDKRKLAIVKNTTSQVEKD